MKKLFVTVLVCGLATTALLAQSDTTDASTSFSLDVITRADYNPAVHIGGLPRTDVDVFSPNISTRFEGNLGKYFSFELCNHWVALPINALYKNTGRADENDWINTAHIDLNVGPWSIGLGKYFFATGSFEQDTDDWDSHAILSSTFWNEYNTFSWGVSTSLQATEQTSFTLQLLKSYYATWAFKDPLYTYNLQWDGEYGIWHILASASLTEYERGEYETLLAIGQQWTWKRWQVTLDWLNRSLPADRPFLDQAMQFQLTGKYAFSDHFDLSLRLGYEFNHNPDESKEVASIEDCTDGYLVPWTLLRDRDYWYGGLVFNYYPLQTQDLRIHLAAAKNNYSQTMPISIGVTYNWSILK